MSENSNQNPQLTAEQVAELRELQEKRKQYEKETAELNAKAQKMEEEQRQLSFKVECDKAVDGFELDTGLKFAAERDVIHKLLMTEPGIEVKPDEDGHLVIHKDGHKVKYAALLEDFAVSRPWCVASWGSLRAVAQEPQSLAEFRDNHEKIRYITKFGLDKFESLPRERVEKLTVSTMSAADFHKMSTREKVKFVEKYGEDAVALVCGRKERR